MFDHVTSMLQENFKSENIDRVQCDYIPNDRIPQLLSTPSLFKNVFQNDLFDEDFDTEDDLEMDEIEYNDSCTYSDRVCVLKKQKADEFEVTFINFLTHEKLIFKNGVLFDHFDFVTGEKLNVMKDDYKYLLEFYELSAGDVETDAEYANLPFVMPVNPDDILVDSNLLNKRVLEFTNLLTKYQERRENEIPNDKKIDDIKSLIFNFTNSDFNDIADNLKSSYLSNESMSLIINQTINLHKRFEDISMQLDEKEINIIQINDEFRIERGDLRCVIDDLKNQNQLCSAELCKMNRLCEELEAKNKELSIGNEKLNKCFFEVQSQLTQLQSGITQTQVKGQSDWQFPEQSFKNSNIENKRSQGHKIYKKAQLNLNPNFSRNISNSVQSSPMRTTIPVQMCMPTQNSELMMIAELNKKIFDLSSYCISLQKKNEELKTKKITQEDVMSYFNNAHPKGISEVGWIILKDIFINAHRDPNGHRYSIETKEIGFILNSKSTKAYNTLRAYLPLPTTNIIRDTFLKDMIKAEKSMLNYEQIPKLLKDYKNTSCHGIDFINSTLAIDAISITPTHLQNYKKAIGSVSAALDKQIMFTKTNMSIEQRKEFEESMKSTDGSEESALAKINSAFIFYLEPHDPTLPCLPLHIYLKRGGSANEVVRKLIDKTIEQIEKDNFIQVDNISSDGDIGHQFMYERTMKELLKLDSKLSRDIITSWKFFDIKYVATADLMHLFKVMRTKCLQYDMNIFPDTVTNISMAETILNCFREGKEIRDLSPLGKMRDSYALLFFSFENLANTISTGSFNEMLIVLPWTCFVNAVTNSALSINSAIKLLEIAYEFMLKFLNILTIPHSTWIETEQTMRCKQKYITVMPVSMLKRVIPTLAALIANLKHYVKINLENEIEGIPEHIVKRFRNMKDFGSERLTTHPEENYNGFLREESYGKDTPQSVIHIAAKATISKNLMIKHNVNIHKRSRANAGGLKVSEYFGVIPEIPEIIEPKSFVDTLFFIAEAIHPEANLDLNSINPELFIAFGDWLQEALIWSKMGKYQRIKTYLSNGTANSKIQSRNIVNQ